MNDVSKTVGGFRSALQDLIVPELKALKVEMRGVRETLERHEKKLEAYDQMFVKIADEIRQLRVDMSERFAAMQKQMDERFSAMQKQMDERFNAMQQENAKNFAVMMNSIGELDKNIALLNHRLDYTERINKIEVQLAQITGASQKSVAAGV